MPNFDPSVIGSIADDVGSPADAQQRGVSIKDAMDREQLGALQLRGIKQQSAEDSQVKSILQNSKYDTPEGLASTAEKVNRVSPKAAMDLLKTGQQYQSGQIQNQLDQLTLADKKSEMIWSAFDSIAAEARNVKNNGGSDLDANARVAQMLPGVLQQLRKPGPDGKPLLPDEALQEVTSQPLTLTRLEALEARTKTGQAALKQRIEQFKADTQSKAEGVRESQADTQARTEQERERHDRQQEQLALKRSGQGLPKPSAGFEWKKDAQGNVILDENGGPTETPIKGGPKDPEGSSMSGRQAVMFTRVAASGNEAAAAIQNITELPVGASSGVLGIGGGPGHGLFSSAKGALTNEMASQDVQDYNTMLAGVKRNLATIESAGLAPSGALTENFASLELRAGDTNMTKLRKLAEMRQIVEKGLEVNLDDPHVPPPQKALVQRIIDQVKKSVPYTQSDVTMLQRAQRKNPDLTLETLMGQQNLRKPETPPAAATSPATPPSSAAPTAAAGGPPGTPATGQLKPGNVVKHRSGATVEILDQ
jgi:hypothetical protein